MIGIGVGGVVVLAGIGGVVYKKNVDSKKVEQEEEGAKVHKFRSSIKNFFNDKHVREAAKQEKEQQERLMWRRRAAEANTADEKGDLTAEAEEKTTIDAPKQSYSPFAYVFPKNLIDIIQEYTGNFIIGKNSHNDEFYRKVTSADFDNDSFKQQFVNECQDGILLFENISDDNSSKMINYPLLLEDDVGLMYNDPRHKIYISSIIDKRCILSYTTNDTISKNSRQYQKPTIGTSDDLKKIMPTTLTTNYRRYILNKIPNFVSTNSHKMLPIIKSIENYPYLYVRADIQGGKKTRRRRSQKKR